MQLNEREKSTITFALSMFKERAEYGPLHELDLIHFDGRKPLDLDEIDSLCEKINADEPEAVTLDIEGGLAERTGGPDIPIIVHDYDIEGVDEETITTGPDGTRYNEYQI